MESLEEDHLKTGFSFTRLCYIWVFARTEQFGSLRETVNELVKYQNICLLKLCKETSLLLSYFLVSEKEYFGEKRQQTFYYC